MSGVAVTFLPPGFAFNCLLTHPWDGRAKEKNPNTRQGSVNKATSSYSDMTREKRTSHSPYEDRTWGHGVEMNSHGLSRPSGGGPRKSKETVDGEE